MLQINTSKGLSFVKFCHVGEFPNLWNGNMRDYNPESSMKDFGEPTHTLIPCWMPRPLPPRNQCTCWFAPASMKRVHKKFDSYWTKPDGTLIFKKILSLKFNTKG